MEITEVNAEREAARYEAKQALRDCVLHTEPGTWQWTAARNYADAALNVWQDELDKWEESMR